MQERFNQYYLTERLASKPLRSVYLAHRVSDASQKVVVKLFDATCLNLDQESESLLQKVKWAKQFKHSHIVPVFDLGVEQGQPYVVSKYLSTGSLRYSLDRLSPQHLDLQESLRIIFQVGQALCYAHQHNILHGNIKPENIFFNKQRKVFLADFRLTSFINVTKLNYKSDPHTTCYMAPEQFSGTTSEQSDQYALACLAYELITGRAPFSAQGFFSMWAKHNTQHAVPLSDLVPDLPEPIERAVLKGMSKDPSERYANLSTFLRALETISLSPTSLSTSTPTRALVAPPNNSVIARTTEPLEVLESEGSFATRLGKTSLATRLLDRPEDLYHERDISKALDPSTEPLDAIPSDASLATRLGKNPLATRLLDHPEDLYHERDISKALDPSTDPLDAIPSDASLATRLGKNPLATRLLERSEHDNHDHDTSKALDIPPSMVLETSPRDVHVEPLPRGRLPQPGKPVTPTLWLAFALSSIVLLMGTVMLYAFVPSRSPASSKHVKSSSAVTTPKNPATPVIPTPQPAAQPKALPPAQPKHQSVNRAAAPPMPTVQPVQTSLTGNYAVQNQTYNLTTEGTIDWSDWGLNTPQDVNHKANVQQQISNFTVIGNATVQRDSYYSNSNIEWFDGTPQSGTALSQTWGVCVTGINNGFSITVSANTKPRTLRIYVGAKLAHGKLTASLDGKTYTDATLDMTHDPNSTQANGVYTLAFNGSASNQMLTVTYTATETNGSNNYVMLQAATLQ